MSLHKTSPSTFIFVQFHQTISLYNDDVMTCFVYKKKTYVHISYVKMFSLKKQPRRVHLNIVDGGRYQQFEKPWPELDFTIHDYISKSEVKTESSCESEVKIHSAHESEVKKQPSHDSTAVEDI